MTITLSDHCRPGSIVGTLGMTFQGPLDIVEQSKAISEVGDLFVANPVEINGESLTVANVPLYLDVNGTLRKYSKNTVKNTVNDSTNNQRNKNTNRAATYNRHTKTQDLIEPLFRKYPM